MVVTIRQYPLGSIANDNNANSVDCYDVLCFHILFC